MRRGRILFSFYPNNKKGEEGGEGGGGGSKKFLHNLVGDRVLWFSLWLL